MKKKMIYSALIFVFGLLIGSFLNAVIYRLHSGESIIKARSHCPKCGHVLAWYELIPVVSFAMQRGRCRSCGEKISFQYPLVEIGTGVLFLVIFNFLNSIYYFVIVSLLVVIFVYDLKHYIIPDRIVYPAIVLAFIYRIFEFLKFNNLGTLEGSFFAAFVASLFFLTIFLLSRGRWMGFGDVKLAFLMGLFLGWPAILPAIFLAFLFGGIIGIALIFAHKKTMKSQVPFGPFLVAGTLVSMFLGMDIVNWYKGFLL